MEIIINGKARKVGAKTLGELMKFLKFDPEKVIVSVNGEPVGKKKFPETVLSEGDRVDVFSFVGGG
jgi:sulfur carrier protein